MAAASSLRASPPLRIMPSCAIATDGMPKRFGVVKSLPTPVTVYRPPALLRLKRRTHLLGAFARDGTAGSACLFCPAVVSSRLRRLLRCTPVVLGRAQCEAVSSDGGKVKVYFPTRANPRRFSGWHTYIRVCVCHAVRRDACSRLRHPACPPTGLPVEYSLRRPGDGGEGMEGTVQDLHRFVCVAFGGILISSRAGLQQRNAAQRNHSRRPLSFLAGGYH